MDAKIMGARIAGARKEQNLSQAQLAQQLFISPQAVGKWERGESIPDILTMNRLAEILAVDLNYFSAQPHSADVLVPPMTAPAASTGMPEVAPNTDAVTYPALANFSGSNLERADFAGVAAPKRTFNGSNLHGTDFSNAALAGSTFSGSDLRDANFNGADLTGCSFSASDLSGASFERANLTGVTFSACAMSGARVVEARLHQARLEKMDMRGVVLSNNSFDEVVFKSADLRAVCMDGQTFTNVSFDRTALDNCSFKGAVLRNVSFRSAYVLTNRYYKALATINFQGATMDKLTYAALKGLGANLAGVAAI